MEIDLEEPEVEVLDKKLITLYIGTAPDVVEWIILNPIEPHSVRIPRTSEVFTIDEYLGEWDRRGGE